MTSTVNGSAGGRRSTPANTPEGPAYDDGGALRTFSDLSAGIVAGYAVIASVWIVATHALGRRLAAAMPLDTTAVDVLAALLLVATTAACLRGGLRRWAMRADAVATAEHRAAEDLRAEDLREVDRIRSMFLANISHELRTPLTNMLGCATTIAAHNRSLDATQVQHLAERLVVNGERLEQLVLDLLQLTPNHDDDVVRHDVVHIDALVEAAVDRRRDHDLHMRTWTSVGTALTDRARLQRIVDELVDNVVRHTPAGTAVWVTATVDDHRTLSIVVEDDGPGIDAAIATAAMEPFVQGGHMDGAASPGLGIGLSIVARHAALLGGRVTVQTPRCGGTRVSVELPHHPWPPEDHAQV